MIKMKDTRGRESTTLSFVTAAFVALLFKFLAAGLQVTAGQDMLINMPQMGAGEFGMAAAAVLAIWLGREWTEKVASKKGEQA